MRYHLALALLSLADAACRTRAPENDCFEVKKKDCDNYYDVDEFDGARACAVVDGQCDGDVSQRYTACAPYTVSACVVSEIGGSCAPEPVDVAYLETRLSEDFCEESVGQGGSLSSANLILPTSDSVLLVEVTTSAKGQTADTGFFVRPTRLTRDWGRATISSPTTASFYLASTGQFSVEFAPDSLWRTEAVETFEALMLFVNPPAPEIPKDATVIAAPKKKDGSFIALKKGNYVFKNRGDGVDYDWGRDMVFKVSSGTNIYLEEGAHVRARIVQTEEKIDGVNIIGYGTLDNHYAPPPEAEDDDDDAEYEIGVNDDRTRQTIVLFGKNLRVDGVTMIHTGPCNSFGYCLNFNPNWAPLPEKGAPIDDQFDASELQTDAPYRFHQAHCQSVNMDDSPNRDFTNCPTSHDDGNVANNVKCMTWQMGTDGVNPGKWGTVQNSFVRVVDDALKAWDSHVVFENIVVWQLALGFPINLGWWQWNQPDTDGTVKDIYVIHNHNWLTSKTDPEGPGGACTIGAEYGSGAPKSDYRISNIFVETAASCAIGLHLNPKAFNRHTTPEGCVGSMTGFEVTNMFFDEEFYQTGGYQDYISGDERQKRKCDGFGRVEDWTVSASIAGRPLAASDFYKLEKNPTVSGISFEEVSADPHPVPAYAEYAGKDASGSTEIGESVTVATAARCVERCHSDWSCDCVAFTTKNGKCSKRRGCDPAKFDGSKKTDVYVRPGATREGYAPSYAPTYRPTSND